MCSDIFEFDFHCHLLKLQDFSNVIFFVQFAEDDKISSDYNVSYRLSAIVELLVKVRYFAEISMKSVSRDKHRRGTPSLFSPAFPIPSFRSRPLKSS